MPFAIYNPTPQVAAAKSLAEESIAQLRAALKDARHAAVARAMALADALGVNPPKTLLARRVCNEHRERLSVRDVTAGGCTYCSSQVGALPRPAADRRKVDAMATAVPEVGASPMKQGVRARSGEGVHHRQLPADAVRRGSPERPLRSSSPKPESGTACSRGSPALAVGPDAPKTTVGQGSPRTQPTSAARARARNLGNRPLSPPLGGGSGLGWNREWCRLVDAWCRNASARFRSRFAGEVVRSARRLHWLAGSGRDPSVRGKDSTGGSRAVDRSTPSETVGAAGWTALVAFAGVADLLEIMGSTAELVISIEVDFSGKLQQSKGKVAVQDEETEARGSDMFSRKTGNFEDDTAALAEESEEQMHLRSSMDSDGANRRRGLLPLKKDNGVSAIRLAAPAVPIPQPSTGLVGATESVVFLAKDHHRPVPSPSELVAIKEEGDTDVESPSEDGEEEGEDEGSNAEREPSPHGSLTVADQGDAVSMAASKAEAADDKADSKIDGGGCAGDVAAPKIPRVSARIILGPSTIEESLATSPLSAFVLQAARRAQYAYKTMSAPDSIHHAGGCALKPTETTHEDVAKKRSNVGVPSTDIDKKRGSIVLGSATSVDQPRIPANDVPEPPPKSPPTDRPSLSCDISATEKLGLACAVETLILPRMRLSLTSKRRKTPASPERGPAMRLRLDTPIELGKRASNPAGTAVAAPLPATGAAAAAIVSVPLPAGTTPGLEEKLFCTRRYIKNPMNRWVGRIDGRRCLLSCSATASANTRPTLATGVVGWQSGGQKTHSHQNRRVGEGTRGVSAMFVPGHAVDVGDVDHRSSVEHLQQKNKQRFFVFGRLPPVGGSPDSSFFHKNTRSGPVGFALRRPLCRNCGRHALQRLRVNASLLMQSECLMLYGPTRADTGRPGWREVAAGDHRALQQFPFEVWQRGRNVAGKIAFPGRLADWACSSGATLCNACLEMLRSAEAPLERVPSSS